MISIEDVSYDHVQLTMVGRIKRPKSVTMDEWRWFWETARQGVGGSFDDQIDTLKMRIDELEDEISEMRYAGESY